MDLMDSKNVNNRIKKRSIAIAVIAHLYLAVFTLGVSLILLLIIGFITSTLLEKDINEARSSANSFNKNFPFRYFGQVFGSFQHVFHPSFSIEKDIYTAIENELRAKTPVTSLDAITITDKDKDLNKSEKRNFIKGDSSPTARGTAITLLLNQSNFGSMRSIEWRVLVGGYVDKNAKFNLIAYSLFTFFFWIAPYLRRETDLISRVRTIYPGSYNDMDVSTQVRCLHEAVFDAMIAELEKNGIDTSDLKVQKMQTMNINISGGKVNMGNVVQGAMNKIGGAAKGVKA
ncbi:MAG: hypothetical protein P8H31_07275 [Porticoccaceae bacterium]|nr:hypothetical protein [Porticoccaceae bacterium]